MNCGTVTLSWLLLHARGSPANGGIAVW